MDENYLTYWGMNKPPFSLTPDPEMLYLSTQHSECLIRLKYAIFSHKGGALLVSDTAGNGKTSVLARLQNDLKDYYSGRVRVVFIDHPTLTPIEMIGEIARQLGGELHTSEKIRSLNYLRDRLFSLYNDNIKVVVIVDEGQMLKDRPDILGELRILLNFCVSDSFLLTFIFSGQKPLDGVLRAMPEFWQRLPVRFFLKNLDFNDTRSLLQFRLRKVGLTGEIFTSDAYEGIYHYSEGCPRIICSVADLCLLIGYAKRSRRIGFVEVSTACRDMESSGDSFHYFAYIKAQQEGTLHVTEKDVADPKPPAPRRMLPKKPDASSPGQPSAPPSLGNAVSCPVCNDLNPKDRLFCGKCGAPLRRKCPKCKTIVEVSFSCCSHCQTDMERERIIMVEMLRESLLPFDLLERNYAIWIQASGITLEKEEKVIIIFPRGNLLSPGAAVLRSTGQGRTTRENCDCILTDRRLIIARNGEPLPLEMERIETCLVSETGKFLGRKHTLIIGGKQGIFTLIVPFGQKKSHAVCTAMADFIQTMMLK